jgi:SPP1 family predicted phage head-tail adaptor
VKEQVTPPLGTLTERVELQSRSATSESEGGIVAVFTPIATVWARVRRLSARQAFVADARGQGITHGVVIRHRSDVKTGDRMIHRGIVLEIVAASDLNGRRAYLSCQCIERAVTG